MFHFLFSRLIISSSILLIDHVCNLNLEFARCSWPKPQPSGTTFERFEQLQTSGDFTLFVFVFIFIIILSSSSIHHVDLISTLYMLMFICLIHDYSNIYNHHDQFLLLRDLLSLCNLQIASLLQTAHSLTLHRDWATGIYHWPSTHTVIILIPNYFRRIRCF